MAAAPEPLLSGLLRPQTRFSLTLTLTLTLTSERVGERILGADACFWTSRMLGVRPSDSVSLSKFWDWRFRFYWVASP